mmetsp:Transcript_40027/g.96585  ORF Transcript_40027/g.96585 Transcript_40027/m.96585 type:complete len:643 (+) Transcript_40027:216-2144(+)
MMEKSSDDHTADSAETDAANRELKHSMSGSAASGDAATAPLHDNFSDDTFEDLAELGVHPQHTWRKDTRHSISGAAASAVDMPTSLRRASSGASATSGGLSPTKNETMIKEEYDAEIVQAISSDVEDSDYYTSGSEEEYSDSDTDAVACLSDTDAIASMGSEEKSAAASEGASPTETKKKKKDKKKKKFPLNARVKIVNLDEEPDLNGFIAYVRSKPKKSSGRIKIIFPGTTETMKVPTECIELCPVPISDLTDQAREYLSARVHLISASEDNEELVLDAYQSMGSLPSEGVEGGACTSAFLNILYDHQNSNPDGVLKLGTIMRNMKQILESRGQPQQPQLSSSRPVQLTSPWEFVPSKNFSGNRRALIIGVRYKAAPWELPNSHRDCDNMMKYLKRYHGFEDNDFTILMDDDKHTPPTRANMLKAFEKFAYECRPNDAVYFHFAGHGGSVPDEGGDETDGMDETMYPMDYLTAGEILDDEVYEDFILHICSGVTLNAVVDSCHSGSVFDLPFELFSPGKGLDQDFSAVHFPHMEIAREHNKKKERMKQERGDSQRSIPPSPRQPRAKKRVPRDEPVRQGSGINRPHPLEAVVKLFGLQKSPHLNGRTGIIKSHIGSNGRQHVFVRSLGKSFSLKPANLQLQ